ncbi:MAG: hypothetical protein M1834_001594 [Cirrosporium novae-zelandiae]|nr:MAG: hypothetical protein M1834_004111 [Cirrosporium novae-zelandiae]KAI9735578.1 MAG: hypothetical protein M1834_001594 [Cirrosporium novae-zelandiae]
MAQYESQNSLDGRIEELWRTLDTKKEGHLDLKGLKRGLRKMDHPLKNADNFLKDILKAVDTNGDGVIHYHEFHSFVAQTEKELWRLFKTIDHDKNGHIDKEELRTAFVMAGLIVSNAKLNQFFEEVDTNHDGVISFDEWRNFLLFIPASTPNLKAVLSYYTSTVTVNPEGDVHVNGAVDNLGTAPLFPSALVAVIASILVHRIPLTLKLPFAWLFWKQGSIMGYHYQDFASNFPSDMSDVEWLPIPEVPYPEDKPQWDLHVLTDALPHPGYFLAGGIAGVVSRTATAPLDRLKVYLIAQTSTRKESLNAAKSGAPIQVAKSATRPLINATKELWRVGGMRSLFAGNGLNVVKVMPESAIKFGAYEASKRFFATLEGHNDPRSLSPTSQFLSGGMGGMVAQCFVYPLDTLKFRMQCETVEGGLHGNSLIIATAKKMWRTNGFTSYYRGLPMGLAGMFPYAAIDLATFEYLKRYLTLYNARRKKIHEDDAAPGNFETAVIGAFSGAMSASVVYPMNLLRTRLQAQGTAVHPPTYTGIWDVTVKTIKKEGIRGLFRGITPNLLKVAPAVSITYVTYENSKKFLGLK